MTITPVPQSGHPARYWHPLDDDRIQCDLCPRECRLHDGQRGFCFVRAREGDRMVLTTYGRSSGFCIDPIEKKPLNHFFPGTSVLSFGTAGCNLGCKFCQNWDISKSKEMDRLMDAAGPDDIADAAAPMARREHRVHLQRPGDLRRVRDRCRERRARARPQLRGGHRGLHRSRGPSDFFSVMDAANVDLKGFTEDFYWHATGGHLRPVLDTLSYLSHETRVWLEITTLLIPGHNDSSEEIRRMCEWVVAELGPDVPHHFSAFHPDYRMIDVPPDAARRRCAGPGRSASRPASTSSTPATSRTARARSPTAPGAAPP